MKKIITTITLLVTSLFSVATFAHGGHGNNNIVHSHNGTDYFLIMAVVCLFVGFVTYYDYKKNIRN